MKDFYYILGTSANATPAEINTAYRKLSRKFQADDHAPDDFLANHLEDIREAYATLGDPGKRRRYNLLLKRYQRNKLYFFKISYLNIAATLSLVTFTLLFGWYVMRSIGSAKKPAPMQKAVAFVAPIAVKHRKKQHKINNESVNFTPKVVKPVIPAPIISITKNNIKPLSLKHDTTVMHPSPSAISPPAVVASSVGYNAYIQANVTGVVNLHQQANYSSAVVAAIPDKAQVKVLEKGGDFYKIAFNNQTGYVPKWVIPGP